MKKLILFLGLIPILSCTEISTTIEPDEAIGYREGGKRYDQKVCLVDNTSGVLCFESLGKTCKREKPCTAVSSLGANQFFTAQEFSTWMDIELDSNAAFKYYMWQIDWFIHPNEDN